MRRALATLLALAPLSAVALGTTVATPAHAVYEVCNPYSLQDFRDQMAAMEKAFEDFDLNEARYQAETAQKKARCIDEPVTPDDVGRFARLRAQMYYFDQKTTEAAEWMLVKLAANGATFPDDIHGEHPLRLVLREVMIEERGEAVYSGHATPPKKGVFLINGRLAQQPRGWEQVKGLVQIFDKKGAFVEGFWVQGTEYNDDVQKQFVSADAGEYKVAKWWDGPSIDQAPDLEAAFAKATSMEDLSDDTGDDDVDTGSDIGPVATPGDDTDDGGSDAGGDDDDGAADLADPPDDAGSDGGDATDDDAGDTSDDDDGQVADVGPVKPDKEPKPPKMPKPPKQGGGGVNGPLLGTGLGLLALGGAAYGAGFAMNTSDPAPGYTGDDLASRRTMINGLVLGSGVLAVTGLGIGVAGLVSHDGARLGLTTRW